MRPADQNTVSSKSSGSPRSTASVSLLKKQGRKAAEFSNSIFRHMQNLRRYDGLVTVDQLGGKFYSETRREELKEIPGAEFYAEQFGITMAVDKYTFLKPGLRIYNKSSGTYQRENKDESFLEICHDFYKNEKDRHGETALPLEQVFYLNSPRNADLFRKLRRANLSPEEWEADQKKWRIVPLGKNLLAVEQMAVIRTYLDDPGIERDIHHIGGIPSIYAALRRKFSDSLKTSLLDDGLDNARTLRRTLEHNRSAIEAMVRLPDAHPSKKVATTLASMLSGLGNLPVHRPEFANHKVVSNALASLDRLLPLVGSCVSYPKRFFPLYEAIVEEVNLILIASHSYELQDFKDAANSALRKRSGHRTDNLRDIAPIDTFLVTSGMNALAEGLHAAQAIANSGDFESLTDRQDGSRPDYFEVRELLTKMSDPAHSGQEKAKILVTTLNPSTPQKVSAGDDEHHWDPSRMVAAVHERMKKESLPIVLVLDTTLEKKGKGEESDLAEVMKAFEADIESGKLKLILCKSYQKYTSLLAAKIMAGGVSIVAKQDADTQKGIDLLAEIERELEWIETDDSQFLTHSLRYSDQDEMILLEQAAANAEFIHSHFFGGKGFDRFQEGMPFGLLADHKFEVKTERAPSGAPEYYLSLHDIVGKEVRGRDSFGFLDSSSVVTLPEGLRIAIGQESREELVEKLSAIGWLNEKRPPLLKLEDLTHEIDSMAASAMEHVLENRPVALWANAALQVIESRLGPKSSRQSEIAACEDLLVHWRMPELRQKLLELLSSTEENIGKEQLIGERMKIVRSVFSPVVADSMRKGSDVEAMRFSVSKKSNGEPIDRRSLQASYLPSMVASMMSLIQNIYGQEEHLDEHQLAQINQLHDVVLSMPSSGISDHTRARLLKGSFKFQCLALAMKDEASQKEGAAKLLETADQLSKPEDRAAVFHRIPHRMLTQLDDETKSELIHVLIGPLSVEVRAAYLQRLKDSGAFSEKVALIESFFRDKDKDKEPDAAMAGASGTSGLEASPIGRNHATTG